MAASLADGNVTIIAITTENKGFVSILSREWNRYLNRDSIFLTTSFVTSELDLDEIDKATIYGQFLFIPACGTERNGKDSKTFWGCNLLVSDQHVSYIGNGQKAQGYGLHKIAGGVERKGQIQMCTRNRIIWDDE